MSPLVMYSKILRQSGFRSFNMGPPVTFVELWNNN